jgi:hypothetical protein
MSQEAHPTGVKDRTQKGMMPLIRRLADDVDCTTASTRDGNL